MNSALAVFGTSGALQPGFPKTAQGFLGAPNPSPVGCDQGKGAALFDPRAFYDPNRGRFWVLFDELEGYHFNLSCTFVSRFWIAVSQTSDPRGFWNVYRFDIAPGSGLWGDYPGFGFDPQATYFSANVFNRSLPDPIYQYAQVCEVNKAKMEAGLGGFTPFCFSRLRANNGLVDTVQPVQTQSPPYGPQTEFFVNSFDFNFGGGQCQTSCSGVVIWGFSNPIAHDSGGGNPILTGKVVATPSYVLPPGADEPGCTRCIATGDPRVSGIPVYHAGSVWGALETGVNNGTQVVPGIFWFELRPTVAAGPATCPLCTTISNASLAQSGYFFFSGDTAASFPALMTDDEGNLFMVFDFMSATINPSIGYVARRVTQSLGKFPDSGKTLRSGVAPTLNRRWGDYEATSYSGRVGDAVWVSSQYSPANRTWASRIGKLNFTLTIP